MKITIYQKDQGSQKTTWKEFAKYDEDDNYTVAYSGGFIWIEKHIITKEKDGEGYDREFFSIQTVFCGGGENFYFTKE